MTTKRTAAEKDEFFQIGKAYFVRTVIYHQIGVLRRIVKIGSFVGLELENAVWCADSGRFTQAMRDGTLSEVELFSGNIVVNLNAISDVAEWNHTVPTVQK